MFSTISIEQVAAGLDTSLSILNNPGYTYEVCHSVDTRLNPEASTNRANSRLYDDTGSQKEVLYCGMILINRLNHGRFKKFT